MRLELRVLFVVLLAAVLYVGLGLLVGWAESAVLVGALAVIGATAWFPPWLARAVGAFWLGMAVVVFTHLHVGLWRSVLLGSP